MVIADISQTFENLFATENIIYKMCHENTFQHLASISVPSGEKRTQFLEGSSEDGRGSQISGEIR